MSTQTNTVELSKKSLEILDNFRKQPDVEDEHYQTLVTVIKASPLLTERFNLAVANKHLTGIKAQSENENAGGGFHPDTREISLPLNSLTENSSKNSMIFVLAHEVQHSFNYQESQDATTRFLQDIQKQAQQAGIRDYTDEIQALITANRKDEASAEIAGFNAVVSSQKTQTRTTPTLRELYETTSYMHDFINERETDTGYTYSLKPNLILNKDMTLSTTPEDLPKNLEAMGRHYFDKSREEAQLGYCEPDIGCQPNDFVDYTNYYATWMVGEAISAERRHNPDSKEPLVLDMQKLKLTEEMLEEAGLFIGDRKPMPYKDIGQNPPFVGRFDHTYDGDKHHSWIPVHQENRTAKPDGQAGNAETKAQALLAKYQSAIEAVDAGKPNPMLETARANPAVQKIMERFDAEWESRQMVREYGESRYSLANMPDRARDLHAQITDRFTAYVKENNLPYSKEGLANSITALTAEAFDQKMTKIDHIAINGNRLMVKQDGRFIHDFAEVDAFQSRLTPERDSFRNIVQAEQKHEQEEQQREMERQMERSRGMVMTR